MDIRNTTLDDISGVIGFTSTLRLSAWFGAGNNLYVPEVVEDGQLLVRLIGRRAAERMAEAFPREHLAIPRPTSYEEDLRRWRIATLLERGVSTRQASVFEKIGERRVQQICRELETAGLISPVGGPEEKGGQKIPPPKAGRKNTPSKS
jgi:hypothetical protein